MGADASGVGSAPPLVDTDAAAIVPAELLQRLAESLEIGLLLNIFGERVTRRNICSSLPWTEKARPLAGQTRT